MAEGYSCSLGVLYGGLEINTVSCIFRSKNKIKVFGCNIFLAIKILDPDLPLEKMPDPDPH
jgi:hypothetical protein